MADFQQMQVPADHSSDDTPGSKRKRSDGQQQRSKRSRYISIACNECKRRKIKCNGGNPCQRCGNLNLDCQYSSNCCSNSFRESDEFKQMQSQILTLQDQVTSLWNNLSQLRTAVGQELPSQQDYYGYSNDASRSIAAPQAPMVIDPSLGRSNKDVAHHQERYQPPPTTSSSMSHDIARSGLQSMRNMGKEGSPQAAQATANHPQNGGPLAGSSSQSNNNIGLDPSFEPLAMLSKDDALRLFALYEDEVGLKYPILDMNRMSQYATLVFTLGEAVAKSNQRARGGVHDADDEFEMIKLVVAIALAAESKGQNSNLGKRIFETSLGANEQAAITGAELTLTKIQITVLIAMYHLCSNNEASFFQSIGLAANMCLKLGLNRASTYHQILATEEERSTALKTFWSVYALERQSHFGPGTAIPSPRVRDEDVDESVGVSRPAESRKT
ncbi:MAG: hypothetical protein M1831_005890 [Alyxoria varia]|nr:MAG: hypothetical protein M1831_005890 [Alyxoria varia]